MSSEQDPGKDQGVDLEAVPKGKPRLRLVTVLVCAGLIAAAYGAGRLQGVISLRSAQVEWQRRETGLSSSLAASTKALASLKSHQVLWEVQAGIADVLANLSDKNYGLARDAAGELSSLLSRAMPDMEGPLRDRLQPLVSLLQETAQGADTLSPDTQARARQARALVRQALDETSAPQAPGTPQRSTP